MFFVPQVRPLAEVVNIVSGFGFPKELQGKLDGDLPFFKVGDISIAWNNGQKNLTQAQHYLDHAEANSIRANAFPKGTVVFAKIGEAIRLNRRAILGQPSLVDNNVMGLIPKEEVVDSIYLFYWSLMLRLGDISQATTVPSVRKSDVEQLSFPWLPLDQQKLIVAEIEKQFSRLDEAVTNLKRVKANLKRYKAAVLKAAVEGCLVETEAEIARREGRSYESGEQLLQCILETRRSQWQGKGKYKEPAATNTTGLPKLPEGWCWLGIDTIGFVTKLAGFEYTKFVKYSPEGDLPVIKAENAGRNGFKRTEFSRVKSESVSQLTRSQLQPGDLLMVFVGAGTGNVARVPDDQPYFLGPNIAMIRVKSNEVSAQYLEMFLRSPIGNTLALSFAKAVAQSSLSMGTIRMIPIALPSFSEQVRIFNEVERLITIADEAEAQVNANLQRAERLRQSILGIAFTGGFSYGENQ